MTGDMRKKMKREGAKKERIGRGEESRGRKGDVLELFMTVSTALSTMFESIRNP